MASVEYEMVDPEPDEDAGFDVNDEIDADDIGDLSDQKGSDVIEPARGVRFKVVKASLDTRTSDLLTKEEYGDKPFLYKQLRVQAAIAPPGIPLGTGDGEVRHAYAGKNFFPDFRLVLNLPAIKLNHERDQRKAKAFNEAWWKNEARLDTKEFMLAVGAAEIDEGVHWKMRVKVNDDFLAELKGSEFIADIRK